MPKMDFLKPDAEQIRHQIRGILDSYSHDWDILAELAQNSVDAIRASDVEKGRISLTVDAAAGKITIEDNGIGIDPSQINKLLRPFGTDKIGKANQIGEKGVGLKFVIFSSSHFKIETSGSKGHCTAQIEQAAAWVGASSDVLQLDLDENAVPANLHGTRVELILCDSNHPLLDYTFAELLFRLQTRTALGDTGYIWGTPLNADFTVHHVDKGGGRKSKNLDCRYLLPTSALPSADVENLDEFKTWVKEQDRSDAEKRKRLLNRVAFISGKKQKGGREIRYWSCFVPRREYWRKLSAAIGLEVQDEDLDAKPEDAVRVGFAGGFETSTKGMPTGVSIDLKPTGAAGYGPHFFIVIDDPSLNFDIGRKSVHGRQQGMLRELAYEVFRDFVNHTRRYLGGDIDLEAANWNRDEVFDEIEALPDLAFTPSRFVKRPNGQEATVAALFFEMIGRGMFPDVRLLISGYKGRYDLYAKWKTKRCVIEFKYGLAGLFQDFNEERKLFNEIDVAVIWEVSENDRVKAQRRGIGVEEITHSALVEYQGFPEASVKLTLGDVRPIYVIELRRLIETAEAR